MYAAPAAQAPAAALQSLCRPSRPLAPASSCSEEPRGLMAGLQQRLPGPVQAGRPGSDLGARAPGSGRIPAVLPGQFARASLEQIAPCSSSAWDGRRTPRGTLAASLPA